MEFISSNQITSKNDTSSAHTKDMPSQGEDSVDKKEDKSIQRTCSAKIL